VERAGGDVALILEAGRRLAGGPDEVVLARAQQMPVNLDLARKVQVESAHPDPGALGDFTDGRRVVPEAPEDLLGRVEDLRPRSLGAARPRPFEVGLRYGARVRRALGHRHPGEAVPTDRSDRIYTPNPSQKNCAF